MSLWRAIQPNGFIQARHYQVSNRSSIRLIVIHTMEAPEKPGTAKTVASWFGSAQSPMASAHLCIDDKEIWECVKPESIAFAAPHANRDGYHIEHAGFAKQDKEGWSDAYSLACLTLSARAAAEIALTYEVPIRRLDAEAVLNGEYGFCGHRDISLAYATKGGHTDPGLFFPWDYYLQVVSDECAHIPTL